MREDRWVSDPGVEIINGEATDVDLNDFCKLGLPGTYTVMATISLANDKGITLTAPADYASNSRLNEPRSIIAPSGEPRKR